MLCLLESFWRISLNFPKNFIKVVNPPTDWNKLPVNWVKIKTFQHSTPDGQHSANDMQIVFDSDVPLDIADALLQSICYELTVYIWKALPCQNVGEKLYSRFHGNHRFVVKLYCRNQKFEWFDRAGKQPLGFANSKAAWKWKSFWLLRCFVSFRA